MKAIIAGGGVGGLTTALMLHARGIDCDVFEQSDHIRELGVGINTLPHAIKELAALAACVTALAVARIVVAAEVTLRSALLVAVPLAALMDCFFAASLPYVGMVAVVAVAALVTTRRGLPGSRAAFAITGAGGCALVLAAPAVAGMVNSFSGLSSNFVNGASSSLGQLVRPLPSSIVSGVWLHILTPLQTTALIVGYALVTQGYGVWKLRKALLQCHREWYEGISWIVCVNPTFDLR